LETREGKRYSRLLKKPLESKRNGRSGLIPGPKERARSFTTHGKTRQPLEMRKKDGYAFKKHKSKKEKERAWPGFEPGACHNLGPVQVQVRKPEATIIPLDHQAITASYWCSLMDIFPVFGTKTAAKITK
jgi:hypothetical protein